MSLRVVKSCQHLQPMWPVIASLRNPVRLSDTPEPIGTDTWRWPALPAASTCAHSGRNKEKSIHRNLHVYRTKCIKTERVSRLSLQLGALTQNEND